MDLKRGVDKAVAAVVEELRKHTQKIATPAETAQVSTISANGDAEIGRMIPEAMQKVGNEGIITVEEAKGMATELDIDPSVEQSHAPQHSAHAGSQAPPARKTTDTARKAASTMVQALMVASRPPPGTTAPYGRRHSRANRRILTCQACRNGCPEPLPVLTPRHPRPPWRPHPASLRSP